MNNNSTYPRPPLLALGRALFAAVALLTMSVAGFAQETTSAIRGNVVEASGAPAVGANVRIVDNRTGSGSTATTSSTGQFTVSGLRVGGPYTVSISTEGFAPQTITDINLALGDTYTFSVMLTAEQIEEITVTAQALQSVQVALGPSATFNLRDLEDAPAINRNINDVISIDPRIYVDEAFNDSVQCAGASSRFNSLTVDGVRQNDNFGLNSNGYPTERMPFPYDAIEQVAVELAPFDVMYGGFTACNINAVTKSGTNEFHGSAFVDYTDDSMSGSKLEGDDITLGSFDETRYGFNLGGPIIQDKLFFFVAYEKLDGANIFGRGPADVSSAIPVLGVTQAQLDRIKQIAQDVYGYDVGGTPASLPNEDEKYLIKVDWQINDNHRAAYTYSWNDGFNNQESDTFAGAYEFSNHYYERGAELTSNVAQLFSNWTDNFSTELRVSYSELDNRQISLGGTDFGEVQIRTFNDPDGAGPISSQIATVFIGADDSRQSNKLDYNTTTFKLAGTYVMGDHVITGGYEYEDIDAFNMFIQHTTGEYRFDAGINCNAANPDGCIDYFEAGQPDDIFYGNAAPSNVPADGSATFDYAVNTLYLQDEFPVGDSVTIVAGLRYDWYTSDSVPRENPNFIARNGYTNASNFDGASLVQPRLGINWDVTDDLSLRGGFGLYSGGNPNVWLSNNYSNDGQTQVQVTMFDLQDTANSLFNIPISGNGNPIYNPPQSLVDGVTNGTANSGVNALDPNFKVPKDWKFAIGATWDFDAGFLGDDYRLMFDYLHTEKEDSAIIVDATLEQIGTAPDGRPIYKSIDRSDPDCATAPATAACANRNFNQDFILSNVQGDDGTSDIVSLGLSKGYDWGLDWTAGYAYTKSSDVSPMTSSVAFSNFANISVSDPNNPGTADSNYNIPHRFTLRLNFRKEFFGDNMSIFTLFAHWNEGRPFSPVFVDSGNIFGDTIDDRHLLYVPTGPSDPNVSFAPGFDQAAFFEYLSASGLDAYAGGIAERNTLNSSWWQKYDIKIEQELPGFGDGHHFAAFMYIENVGNLINDDWGVMKEQDFPRNLQLVTMGPITNGQYVYNSFQTPAPQSRVSDASLWEIRFGIKYSF